MKKPHEMLKENEDVLDICKHHWIIEEPNGATSNGVCKKCGKNEIFPNSIQEQNKGYKERMWHGVNERKKRAALKPLQKEFSDK